MIVKYLFYFLAFAGLINVILVEGGILPKILKNRLFRRKKAFAMNSVPAYGKGLSTILVSNVSHEELHSTIDKILRTNLTEVGQFGAISVGHMIVTITPEKPFWKRKRTFSFVPLVRRKSIKRAAGKGTISLEMISPPKSWFSSSEAIEIVAEYELSEGSLIIEYKALSKRSSPSEAILYVWKSFLDKALRNELGLLTSRKKLILDYQAAADAKAAEAKKRRLDEIIHPEKYRSRRSNSGNGSSIGSGGSGRYTPSAAAQARRQVKGK